MSNAFIYYRGNTTTTSTHPNPTSLNDSQKLIFNDTSVRLESISRGYKNNIVDTPSVTSNGSRVSLIQDNGLISNHYMLNCSFRMDKQEAITAYTRLHDFMVVKQLDDKYPFGQYGLYSPNMDAPFSVDPDATTSDPATRGFTIHSVDLSWNTRLIKTLDVRIALKFGGKVV